MNDPIDPLLRAALRDLAVELGQPGLATVTDDTRLFGPQSPLDSMALVSLIADLEARVATELGRNIVLADERAMSQVRSPFRTVASLRAHLAEHVRAAPTP